MIGAQPIISRLLIGLGVGQYLNPQKTLEDVAIQTGIIAGATYALPQLGKFAWKEAAHLSYRGVTAQMAAAGAATLVATPIATGIISQGLAETGLITETQAEHYQDAMLGILQIPDVVLGTDLGAPLPASGIENVKNFPRNFYIAYLQP